ncbi:hypothetical protein [uncultured Tateyamaria sp.]|uniref:hypothetical protein n=1 Tax=uncultured Tateyamaria sp. TaxID=455651 RepID=UPI00261A6BAE|nr:hypothetical protein [uncultured Tateyamaria sp.]
MEWVFGLVASIFAFWFGRIASQSEKVLDHKKRVYEDFLEKCPTAQDAYGLSEEQLITAIAYFDKKLGVLSLYAQPAVLIAARNYFAEFAKAADALDLNSPPLHDAFQAAAAAYNDLVYEMRRDAMSWSIFGLVKKGPRTEPKLAKLP